MLDIADRIPYPSSMAENKSPNEQRSGLLRVGGRVSIRGAVLPPGPWDSEPDHEDFRSPEGLPCVLRRSALGSWCGYVGVPPGHPWHGKDYGDINDPHPDVHGGLTYSDRCQGAICHVPQPGESDDVWWLGFDCNHSGDLSLYDVAHGGAFQHNGLWTVSYKTAEYAREQTLHLAAQAHSAR
jgi:hypothetical protein